MVKESYGTYLERGTAMCDAKVFSNAYGYEEMFAAGRKSYSWSTYKRHVVQSL
jgi:hypothetical protein